MSSGFMSKTCPVTVFKVNTPAVITLDKLKQFAFQPIDELKTETKGVGWTSFDDMLDTAWSSSGPEYGEWLCFALRVDTRKIPAAVLKKHLAEAYKDELEKLQVEGKNFISQGRKKSRSNCACCRKFSLPRWWLTSLWIRPPGSFTRVRCPIPCWKP